jgi:Protein of unknown function (DUF1353)
VTPHFLDPVILVPLKGGRMFYLYKRLRFFSKRIGTVEVPENFETDLASIPRIFWGILSPWGDYGPAAIVHDWLYWTQPCTRKQADEVILEGMVALGVGAVTRWIIYHGVRWFAWFAWRDDAGLRHRNSIARTHFEPEGGETEWPASPSWKRRSLVGHLRHALLR